MADFAAALSGGDDAAQISALFPCSAAFEAHTFDHEDERPHHTQWLGPGSSSGAPPSWRHLRYSAYRIETSLLKRNISILCSFFWVSDPVRRSQGLRRDPGEPGQDFRTFNREKVYRQSAPASGRTLPGLGEVVLLRPRRLGLGNSPCRAGKTVQI